MITGKIILTRAPFELGASVRYMASTLQTPGRLAGRRVDLDLAPAWLHGDHTRVEQIVDNLLVNAASYTPPGGHLRVRVSREADEAVLRVSDN